MTRTFLAAVLTACGLTSASQAQMYYHAPGYTSYYAPAYSNYSYTTGYGPLGIFSPRAWFGGPTAYTSPFYGSTYTTAYSPTYTASYSPVVTTSYYAPTSSTAVASACCAPACCTPCCAPCGSCPSCVAGNCPGGNCSLNYSPSASLRPEPDPASSGSSGSKTFQNQSGGTENSTDNFGPPRNRPDNGFDGDTEYGAGYRPEQKIEKRAPATTTDEEPEAEPEAEAADDAPAAGDSTPASNATPADNPNESGTDDASGNDATGGLGAPGADDQPEAVVPALNLDTRITAAPSLLRQRTRMTARFGSPQLARAKVDPATLPAATELRLVRK